MQRLIEISGQEGLQKLARAMAREANGKQLRKDLTAQLKTAVAPAVSAVAGKLQAIPHNSATQASPALGSYLASRVRVQVHLGGQRAGVAVRIGQTVRIRGFRNAARRLNRDAWRHPVFTREGRAEVWVEQHSPIPRYFDETLGRDRDRYRAAVLDALARAAVRMTDRS